MDNVDLKKKYNPEGSELRKAQYRMLEMLCYIDKVCKEHSITYWLDSGTLLGAVRHGGFIPWDDDTDICMPESDAKRFKKVMLSQYSDCEFVLQCRETDPGFFGAWLVIRDRKSEYLQDSNLHRARKYRGLQVDIFIVKNHNMPILHKIASALEDRLIARPLRKYSFSKLLAFSCQMWYGVNYGILFRFFNVISMLFSGKEYFTFTYGTCFKDSHLIESIFPLQRLTFEGREFNVPKNADKYLTESYGDWRRIPGEDEIETHNVKVVFYNDVK